MISFSKINKQYGKQVLFVYDKAAGPTLRVSLRTPGRAALQYDLDGRAANYSKFDGHTLSDLRLKPGHVAIFRIDP